MTRAGVFDLAEQRFAWLQPRQHELAQKIAATEQAQESAAGLSTTFMSLFRRALGRSR